MANPSSALPLLPPLLLVGTGKTSVSLTPRVFVDWAHPLSTNKKRKDAAHVSLGLPSSSGPRRVPRQKSSATAPGTLPERTCVVMGCHVLDLSRCSPAGCTDACQNSIRRKENKTFSVWRSLSGNDLWVTMRWIRLLSPPFCFGCVLTQLTKKWSHNITTVKYGHYMNVSCLFNSNCELGRKRDTEYKKNVEKNIPGRGCWRQIRVGKVEDRWERSGEAWPSHRDQIRCSQVQLGRRWEFRVRLRHDSLTSNLKILIFSSRTEGKKSYLWEAFRQNRERCGRICFCQRAGCSTACLSPSVCLHHHSGELRVLCVRLESSWLKYLIIWKMYISLCHWATFS